MQLRQEEISTLRSLAHQYMEIASLPIQRKKMELWKAFNRHDQTRPLVTIFQQPWNELNYDGSLTCSIQNPLFRMLEDRFRKAIYCWDYFPVDMVLEPVLTIPFCASNSGYGLSIQGDNVFTDKNSNISSHNYQNLLVTEEDIEKIKDMQITLDKDTSKEWLETAHYIFDGILPIRQAGGVQIPLQIWDILAQFMNVENIYYDLYDRPEFIHKIMERMTQSTLGGIKQANELGLYDTSFQICHCSIVYTDELLPDFNAGTANDSFHTWGFSMAQAFTATSPATTEEFELPYAKQLASQFGMMYYGCCERLDDRLEIIQQIPNLRKISCSPWSNKENFASHLKKDIIMSNKPSPSFLAAPSLDHDLIEKDLRETCEIAKRNGVKVEILLKDISTVKNHPERLVEWAKIAMKVVEDY